MFELHPAVYLVENEYQIVFATEEFGIAWAEVAGERYCDERNGLMRSETKLHRCAVPAEVLDKAGAYRVCFKAVPERRPYFPESGPLQYADYAFKAPGGRAEFKALMLADTHSRVKCPVELGRRYIDDCDLLIMNGDIPAESKRHSDMMSVLQVESEVCRGEKPVIYVRGNHDTRGKYALDFPEFIGNSGGNTYFTFRCGDVWGVALDCGEDKMDNDVEYGDLVCCTPMRRRELEFLKRINREAAQEYAAPGVKRRIAICHVPFCVDMEIEAKFDIENEIYAGWTRELNEMGIEIMLCGHMHLTYYVTPDDRRARYGMKFPVAIGSYPFEPGTKREDYQGEWPPQGPCAGTLVTIGADSIETVFVDSNGKQWGERRFDV